MIGFQLKYAHVQPNVTSIATTLIAAGAPFENVSKAGGYFRLFLRLLLHVNHLSDAISKFAGWGNYENDGALFNGSFDDEKRTDVAAHANESVLRAANAGAAATSVVMSRTGKW